MNRPQVKAKYEAALIAAGFIWGTSFVSAKIGVESIDPFLFSFLRFLFASILFIIVLLIFGKFDLRLFGDKLIWGIAGFNSVALELQHLGMTMTTATNAVLLVDINVVFVAILAFFILSERITLSVICGLILGLLGVVVVSTNGDLSLVLSGSFSGNALVFAAGILWAFYIVYQKKVLMKEIDVLLVTSNVILATTIILFPLTLIFVHDYTLNLIGLESSLYTGILCTALAFFLYNFGLRGTGATMASIILLLEIVFAMLFAFIVLNEVPSYITLIGGVLIIAAILLVSFKRNEKEKGD
ncbi:MAG: DMT family transporter [Methanomassiliicoccales archaeon]